MDVPLRAGHADFLADLSDARAEIDVLRTIQAERVAPVAAELQSELPPVFGLLYGTDVEGHLLTSVAELRGVRVLVAVARRGGQRRRQNHVRSGGAVQGDGDVGAVAEQPDVEAGLQLLGTLRPQDVSGLLAAGLQPADAVLRGGESRALGAAAEDLREIPPRGDIGPRRRAAS